jgi:hypothetical protein
MPEIELEIKKVTTAHQSHALDCNPQGPCEPDFSGCDPDVPCAPV